MIACRRGDRSVMVKRVQRLLHLYPDGIFGRLTAQAVCDFQRQNGLKVDGIVGLRTWSRLLGLELLPKSQRVIRELIVHCTATPAGRDFTVDDIRRWHKQQGWSDIGYHYVVYRNGVVAKGRSVQLSGAHCDGHNSHSIGIAYVGGVSPDGRTAQDTRTDAQKESLRQLLMELKRQYPAAQIYGHRDFSMKDWPSFDAKREYIDI